MDGVRQFLRAWEEREHPDNQNLIHLRRSPAGNLSSTGLLGNYDGPSISPYHVQFNEAIEPGVRDLVALLVNERGWVTYTSCEGHLYPGEALTPAERHVGVFPRDSTELSYIEGELRRIIANCRMRTRSGAVELDLHREDLWDAAESFPVLDLFFRRAPYSSWAAYFHELESVYRITLSELALPVASASLGRDMQP